MILDKRMLPNKRPLTCLDIDKAREFEGKTCIFADSYADYKDIEEYAIRNPCAMDWRWMETIWSFRWIVYQLDLLYWHYLHW